MASSKKQRCLQSSSTGDELDSSLGYKAVGKFHKEKLPTRAEVTGYVVHLIKPNWSQSYDHAYHLCRDTLRKHWIDRNIYAISLKRVKSKTKFLLDNFRKSKNVALLKRNDK